MAEIAYPSNVFKSDWKARAAYWGMQFYEVSVAWGNIRQDYYVIANNLSEAYTLARETFAQRYKLDSSMVWVF